MEPQTDQPTDLTDVIGGALEGVEGRTDAPPAEEKEVDPEAEKEEAELAALEQDIRAKNPAMAGNIAVHRHQAVLTRTRNQAKAEQEALQKQLEAWKPYEWAKDPELQQALAALHLAETDQKKFVELLLQDERFANLIALKDQQQAQKPVGDQRPGPNATSPDGTYKYYDDQGLQQLMEWERAQAVKEATEVLKKEFGPVKAEYEQRNAWNTSLTEQKKILDGAREKWPGFKDHEPQIKDYLVANHQADLNEAYRAVVVPSFEQATKVNKEALRKELLEEMKRKPGAAQSLKPSGGVEREASDKPRDLEDVIRESLPRDR